MVDRTHFPVEDLPRHERFLCRTLSREEKDKAPLVAKEQRKLSFFDNNNNLYIHSERSTSSLDKHGNVRSQTNNAVQDEE